MINVVKCPYLQNPSTDRNVIWPQFFPGKGHSSPPSGLNLLSGFREGKSKNKENKNKVEKQCKTTICTHSLTDVTISDLSAINQDEYR